MSNNSSNVSVGQIALHTFLVLITGGFWFVVLIIWFLLKAIKKN